MNKQVILVLGVLLATLAVSQACVKHNKDYTPFCNSVKAFPSKYYVGDLSGSEFQQKNGDTVSKSVFEDAQTRFGSTVSDDCKKAFGQLMCPYQLKSCHVNSDNTQSDLYPCQDLCDAAEKACPADFFDFKGVQYCAKAGEQCFSGSKSNSAISPVHVGVKMLTLLSMVAALICTML